MRELIKALHVIQDECKKHYDDYYCKGCPMSYEDEESRSCNIVDKPPVEWKINDELQKALL